MSLYTVSKYPNLQAKQSIQQFEVYANKLALYLPAQRRDVLLCIYHDISSRCIDLEEAIQSKPLFFLLSTDSIICKPLISQPCS